MILDKAGIRRKIKEYSYYVSRRKKLEQYKIIFLNREMKELSAKEKLKIKDQKYIIMNSPEYKNLLKEIKKITIKETECYWFLNKYLIEINHYIIDSSLDRKNNWNIHSL